MSELLKALTKLVEQGSRLMEMIIDQEQERMDERVTEKVAEPKIKAPRRTPPPRR